MQGKRRVCFKLALFLVFAELFCEAQFGLSENYAEDLEDTARQKICEQVDGALAWEFGWEKTGVKGWVVGPSWRVWDGDTSRTACAKFAHGEVASTTFKTNNVANQRNGEKSYVQLYPNPKLDKTHLIGVSVSVSLDGSVWQALGVVNADLLVGKSWQDGSLVFDASEKFRYVRLAMGTGGSITCVAAVGVFQCNKQVSVTERWKSLFKLRPRLPEAVGQFMKGVQRLANASYNGTEYITRSSVHKRLAAPTVRDRDYSMPSPGNTSIWYPLKSNHEPKKWGKWAVF
jgi:hypothetical protein